MSFICEFCNNTFTTRNHLLRHNKSDSCLKIQKILNNTNIKYINKIKIIEDEYNLKILEMENKNKILENKIQELIQDNNTLKTEIKALEKASEGYRKIVEKAATKSTNNCYVNKNYQHNNYLNYISSEPIKFSELNKQLQDVVTEKSIMYDDEDFHNHIVDNILKDKNGKDKLLCTDINRKNFTYKDEKSGELISDPELERLREELKKGTDINLLRRYLLDKLVAEYEDNGYVGIDPFVKFTDIIKKLNFGSPFVEHVAKKTYIKTKNTSDVNYDKKNDNQVEMESYDESLSYDEEEYQKLLKEFGDKI